MLNLKFYQRFEHNNGSYYHHFLSTLIYLGFTDLCTKINIYLYTDKYL